MRPDVCCTGPRPCAGAGGRRWSIRVRNTFPLISGETSCADTQMQIFVCKNNLQFSWTSQVFPHMLMLVLTAVGVELPSHWAVSSLQSVWAIGHVMSDVMFLYNNDAIMPCGDWSSYGSDMAGGMWCLACVECMTPCESYRGLTAALSTDRHISWLLIER